MELTPTEGATVKTFPIPSTGEGENGEHLEFSHTTEGYKQVQPLWKFLAKAEQTSTLGFSNSCPKYVHTQQKCGHMLTKRQVQKCSQQHHYNSPRLEATQSAQQNEQRNDNEPQLHAWIHLTNRSSKKTRHRIRSRDRNHAGYFNRDYLI